MHAHETTGPDSSRDFGMSAADLASVAGALRATSDDYTQAPADEPVAWMRRSDGTWCPVYADGWVGPGFSWAQMLAARGEDLGDVLVSLVEAGLLGQRDRKS